ncbi:hypothetical protein Sjap_026011 [Stephania japonica]|uniref:Uncharacterized protein n=1 Tax=Stephania japonica TaxID=461633 RepID=A0AAP0E2P9_9MAGN
MRAEQARRLQVLVKHLEGRLTSTSKERGVEEILGVLESEDFLARFKQAFENRNTEVEGPETESQSIAQLESRRQELTQATLDRPVDEMALYYDMVGDCTKGRVYGLRSLGSMKRRIDGATFGVR